MATTMGDAMSMQGNAGVDFLAVGRLISAIGVSRTKRGLDADDVFVLLAAGWLSVFDDPTGVLVRPTTCSEIGKVLGMPRETVRRRVLSLADRSYLTVEPKGVRLSDVTTWRRLAATIVRGPQP